jgi:ABC-type polysaccharide/polyol phosphate transport system ATPase subunit
MTRRVVNLKGLSAQYGVYYSVSASVAVWSLVDKGTGMIQVKHLTCRYGELMAVNDVSFDINQGEVVGLLGHNADAQIKAAGRDQLLTVTAGAADTAEAAPDPDGSTASEPVDEPDQGPVEGGAS